MKMKVIRDHLGSAGMLSSGHIIDVPEHRAREMEQKGLAVPLIDRARVEAMKGAASEGAPRPTQTPQNGGPTGEAKPASSSPAAPARAKRRYTKRKEKPAS